MTDISVDVVSRPQKAHQSLTTIPAPITSEPRLMVPIANRREEESEEGRGEGGRGKRGDGSE